MRGGGGGGRGAIIRGRGLIEERLLFEEIRHFTYYPDVAVTES